MRPTTGVQFGVNFLEGVECSAWGSVRPDILQSRELDRPESALDIVLRLPSTYTEGRLKDKREHEPDWSYQQ